jgi:hypothetical protein
MNMLFRCASRLIVICAFTLIPPTFASASDATPSDSFKLAMGPMSAAQKNQGASEKADEVKPHHHIKQRRVHHRG